MCRIKLSPSDLRRSTYFGRYAPLHVITMLPTQRVRSAAFSYIACIARGLGTEAVALPTH